MGALDSAEIYTPGSNKWAVTGSLTTDRYAHTASLLADGRVLVVGGDDETGWSPLASAEIYSPGSNSWSLAAGSLKTARYYHTAATLADGRVLVMEGVGADGTLLTDAELYQPATQIWSDAGSLSTYREGFTATRLVDGRVLVAGGYNANPLPAQCEIYSPPAAKIDPGSIFLLLMD
jgi:N-acetylneuraminic acid mutarotase